MYFCINLKDVTKLSVNINKIATLRNARGGNSPNLIQLAKDIQDFGAHGITIHPRPDERHIRYKDAYDLKDVVYKEYNIEGNPTSNFMQLVLNIKPTQVTLVPDSEDAITSNAGWDCKSNKSFLTEIITDLRNNGIRTSIFVDPKIEQVSAAKETGTDRIELYTENFARGFSKMKLKSVEPYSACSKFASKIGLGVNAGHDLSLENIKFFKQNVPEILEVSIGHALITESIYFGIENVINMYNYRLQ